MTVLIDRYVSSNFRAQLAQSKALFGYDYFAIHLELDRYARRFPGNCHQRILHHKLGVEWIVKKYGPEAEAVAIQHIIADGLIKNPITKEIYDNWNDGFGWSSYPRGRDLDGINAIIKMLFPKYFNHN